jgi:hypothetical protein
MLIAIRCSLRRLLDQPQRLALRYALLALAEAI